MLPVGSRRLSFSCVLLCDCLSPVLVWSLPLLLSKGFRSGMVSDAFKRREGVRGSRVKNVQKKSWRVQSQMKGGRSGRSIGRQLLRGVENGPRAPQRRVERKTGGTKAWRQRRISFEPGLRSWKRRKVKESKEVKGFHQGDKAAWKKGGVWRWTSRMRPRESQEAG